MSDEFTTTDQNRVRHSADLADYDKATVFRILDESWIAQVGFVIDGKPYVIPMYYARDNEDLIFHGSTKSRLMQMLGSGQEVCISVTQLDGLVLARSLFRHSMNYRSVSVFGRGQVWSGNDSKLHGLKVITDRMIPGRWEDARKPSVQELKATSIVAVRIASAAAKVRTGGPNDSDEDRLLPVWAGEIPFNVSAGAPQAVPELDDQIQVPAYVSEWLHGFNNRELDNG